jgi:hypothetical protein
MQRLDALHPGDRIHRLFRKLHADRWHETPQGRLAVGQRLQPTQRRPHVPSPIGGGKRFNTDAVASDACPRIQTCPFRRSK